MCANRIYLDMDGVLCDMTKAVVCLHDRPDLIVNQSVYEFGPLLGMTNSAAWKPVLAADHTFWEELEPYPWTFELWAWAHEVGEVYVCSKPVIQLRNDGRATGNCIRGKMTWLRRNFGTKFKNVIFTPHKHLLSQPGAVLIDDDERYADKFNEYGGRQIVFPQPYNRTRGACRDRMDYVRQQYALLRKRQCKS